MFFFRSIIMSGVFVCTVGFSSESVVNVSEQVKKVFPSIVKIKVQRSAAVNDESELVSTDLGGSGFILDGDHRIVTNAHVVTDAKKIVIVDINETEYPAVLIGKDEKTDIAVLEAAGLSASIPAWGEGDALVPGESVFILGSPYSLGYSVSVGVVSAVKRFLPNYPYLQFIQTDAAINPGNSGGGVFNLNGELVGMASTYFSRQGGYTNIGFVIPVEEVRRIAQLLCTEQKVVRGYLGAELLISDKLSRKMGYHSSVLITRVYPQSPAEQSGLRGGDLIIALNGENFRDSGMLHRFLERSAPDQNLSLSYVRNKKLMTAAIRLKTATAEKKMLNNAGTADQAEKLGLVVGENGDNEGLEVLLSYAGAKSSGIDPHDRIMRINGNTIKNINDLNIQLGKLKENDIVMVSIIRNGENIVLPIGSLKGFKVYTTEN